MKKDYTRIAMLLDDSGSMHSRVEEVRAAVNAFVDGQKPGRHDSPPGECVFSLWTFSSGPLRVQAPAAPSSYYGVGGPSIFVRDPADNSALKQLIPATPVAEVGPLTEEQYNASGGSTALYDATCVAIDRLGEELAATPEADRPDSVIFVVMTDGYENHSIVHNVHAVLHRIKHQEQAYNWRFLFLGAKIDAESEASKIGIHYSRAYNIGYRANAFLLAANHTSSNVSGYRQAKSAGIDEETAASHLDYTDAQKMSQR